MELRINEYKLPEALTFNYDELKAALTEKVKIYETMVYGDDQIQQAKKDRADLNRLKKALNDERIRREKEYMIPFNEFKKQISEIIAIIDQPAAIIDKRVKEFEEEKKQAKMKEIEEMFNSLGLPEYVTFDKVFDPRWLNSSTAPSQIKCGLEDIVTRHNRDIAALEALTEYSFEAKEYYKQSLDIAGALMQASKLAEIAKAKKAAEEEAARRAEEQKAAEAARIAREAAEAQQEFTGMPEPIIEEAEPGEWVKFEARLTTDQALALKEFFESRMIAFRPIV